MSFVSYAQNFEDVMLARVFRGVEAGFYIDVGAQDPRIDSVTKAFYDRGWRGINLEPVEAWHLRLCQDRPRDINLCLAAGAAEGVLDFHEVIDSGLSTSSAEFARRHQAAGHGVVARKVRVRPLDDICAEHDVRQVHFLKVDAEGDEPAVLRGIDLARVRPWVILVEATEPNAAVSTHEAWESLIVDRGYAFVYNDGLNRFYLASEHEDLAGAFATPPNVFDDFLTREILDHRRHEEGLLEHIGEVEALARLRAETIERLERIVAQKDEDLARVHEALASHQARLGHAQAELAECDARVASLGERVAELAALADRAAEQQAALAANLQDAEARSAALAAKLQDAEARSGVLAARLQGTEQTVAGLSRSLLDARAARQAAEAGWTAATAELQATLAMLARAQQDFQAIVTIRSWRLTEPLRRAVIFARGTRARVAATHPSAQAPTDPDQAPAEAAIAQVRPAVLALSEDAERILARCPVLENTGASEDPR